MKEFKETFSLFMQSLLIVGFLLAATSPSKAEKKRTPSAEVCSSEFCQKMTLDLRNQKR